MKYIKGPWQCVFTSDKTRGVRTSSGFICFLTKPFRYAGQDDRYEQELEEIKGNQKLISKAPEMYEALSKIKELIAMDGDDLSDGECIDKIVEQLNVLKELEDK
jgi:hypothetical protein